MAKINIFRKVGPHILPDTLAKVDVLVEERLVYKLEILNHPSCYLFSQDVHEH